MTLTKLVQVQELCRVWELVCGVGIEKKDCACGAGRLEAGATKKGFLRRDFRRECNQIGELVKIEIISCPT